MGSIHKFHLLQNNFSLKRKNNAIYCSAPFPYENYRTLSSSLNDEEYYNVSSGILTTAAKNFIELDLKLHPISFNFQLKYYKKLIDFFHFNEMKIISNVPAEKLLPNYNLIIIDFLGTALIPYILSLKVPIILYLNDSKLLNVLTARDLYQRCYIAKSQNELEDLFELYNQKKLPSKWNEKIIDQYVYPISKGNPGKNIADYLLKEVIKSI